MIPIPTLAIPQFGIPVTILAGHGRSGKTSFLLRLQRQSPARRTAIIGKELAAHPHGLAELLLQMKRERDSGLAAFERVIVECDGGDSPARTALGLFVSEAVDAHYRLDAIVTIVDALHGLSQLSQHDAALEQVALADRLLLSKTDLVSDRRLRLLTARLHEINPRAPVQTVRSGWTDLAQVFDTGAFTLEKMLELEPRFFCQPDHQRRLPAPGLMEARQHDYDAHAQGNQQYLGH
jgi:G3E family GTPase